MIFLFNVPEWIILFNNLELFLFFLNLFKDLDLNIYLII